jgi:hypothetical protein
MALRVIKNEPEKEIPSDQVFIVEVKNQKQEIGYVGNHNGKIFVFKDICSEVIKFKTAKEARAVALKISNVQTRILNNEKIEKILSKQKDIDVVIPAKDIAEDLYCVAVLDTNTNEKIGHLGYKPELKQYYLVESNRDKDKPIAFWEGETNVDSFIGSATSLVEKHKNLKLVKELLNKK